MIKKFKIFSDHQSGNIVNIKTENVVNMVKTVKNTFTPTGDFEKDKERGEKYAEAMGMDQANTKMTVVMATQGTDAVCKAMISEFTKDNKFDYNAMRDMYG